MVQKLTRYGLPSILLRITTLLFIFPFLFPGYASAQFFQPGVGEVWQVGEVMTIEYQTTMTNYTVALWQEGPPASKTALKGPILYRTLEGPDTGFKWKVQLYGFNLEESDRFFLWLKRGGPENQDNMNAQRMSSPYFKITKKAVPSTTSKPSTTTDPSPSTSGSTESPSAIPTAASSTSTSANPSSTAPSPANDPETSTQGTSGLPVGAQAGIGVGVSVIGLTCIVCALLWYRHLKKKRQILADSQQNGMTNYSPGMSDAWKVPGYSQGHSLYPPAELRPGPSPVEIGTGGDIAEMPTPRDYRRAELGNR